jgi:integrase
MCPQDLELGDRQWKLPRELTKGDRAHTVPLSAPALDVIQELLADAAPRDGSAIAGEVLLFAARRLRKPGAPGARSISGWSKYKAALDGKANKLRPQAQDRAARREGREPSTVKIAPWTLHDLRRTAATWMASLEVAPHVIERLLNHATGTIRGVAAVYNRHSYLPEMRQATDLWGAHVLGLALADEAKEGQLVGAVGQASTE